MVNYISTPEKQKKNSTLRLMMSVFSSIFVMIIAISGIIGIHSEKKAEALDLSQWVMCSVLPSPADTIYQWTETSDLPYALRSKSAVNSGYDDIDSGLNWLLDISGPGFKTINEKIIGQSLDTVANSESTADVEKNYNKGVEVNPFDRFGVAGLKFSAYNGEWKYIQVDACNSDSEAKDPKAGLYYKDRLEPRSTWENVNNSTDQRTVQFSRGIVSQYTSAQNDVIANGIFTITKFIVTVTISLINFAFSDIVNLMGLNKLIGGNGGIFQSLYKGIFMPLIVVAFVATACKVFLDGIVRRQYRSALVSVIRSFIMFVIAVVIAAAPAKYIALPNDLAVGVQSIILTTMNSGLVGGDGLCTSNVGQFKSDLVTSTTGKKDTAILQQASTNMRSAIGCQFWQMFLVTPWSEGQFGTSWNNLWAKGKIAKWVSEPSAAKTLNNGNTEMVGNAEVPLGNGKVINNWAIYQISTQTNAHAPTDTKGTKSKYTSGVANDWWRIVDALSNYQEETVADQVQGIGSTEKTTVQYTQSKKVDVSPYWNTWVGNDSSNRIWISSSSVLVAFIGTLAPLLLSGMSAVYAVGIAILMAFAPLMFLAGCWSGKGWEAFKGWGELVLNTTMKRIVVGVLLVLSITMTMAAIKLMSSIGWMQGVIVLGLLSLLVYRSRHKIFDAMASFHFANVNMSNTANNVGARVLNGGKSFVKNSSHFVGSAAVGGVTAKRAGGSIHGGIGAALKNEIQNMSYRNKSLRAAITQYEIGKQESDDIEETISRQKVCVSCGEVLEPVEENGIMIFQGGRDANGNLLCYNCYIEGMDPDADEVIFKYVNKKSAEQIKREKDEENMLQFNQLYMKAMNGYSNVTKSKGYQAASEIVLSDHEEPENREEALKNMMDVAQIDIADYKQGDTIPSIPTEIAPYVDEEQMKFAWLSGQYDYVLSYYVAGFIMWYQSETNEKFSQSIDEIIFDLRKNNRALNRRILQSVNNGPASLEDAASGKRNRRRKHD